MKIGVHVSIAGSIDRSVERALAVGCTTFQIFTRNPRGWSFSDLSPAVVAAFSSKLRASGISPAVGHMPYLPNLASPADEMHRRSVDTLRAEYSRCGLLGIPYLVTHLGSHMGSGIEAGRSRVVSALDEVTATGGSCMILLENTAGQKNSLGSTLEDLCAIIDRVQYPARIGICLDTCHAFGAGYDVRTGMGEILDNVDRTVGIKKLKVIHANDSKGGLGSHLDRHEHIGLGAIGEEGFRSILSESRVRSLPLIMETPVDRRRDDRGNIIKLYQLAGEAPPFQT